MNYYKLLVATFLFSSAVQGCGPEFFAVPEARRQQEAMAAIIAEIERNRIAFGDEVDFPGQGHAANIQRAAVTAVIAAEVAKQQGSISG